MNIPLEIKVIEKFIRKEKQERYKQFVSSTKARIKFIKELPHFRDFKWDLLQEVNENEKQTIFQAFNSLQNYKSTCYVISENALIDQKELSISEAIEIVGSDMATILVFGDANMIYFEGEAPKNRYISKPV